MRTYRPRVLLAGPNGMGQTYLGPAILHHLEGFHIQNFDLGTLLGDSTGVNFLFSLPDRNHILSHTRMITNSCFLPHCSQSEVEED